MDAFFSPEIQNTETGDNDVIDVTDSNTIDVESTPLPQDKIHTAGHDSNQSKNTSVSSVTHPKEGSIRSRSSSARPSLEKGNNSPAASKQTSFSEPQNGSKTSSNQRTSEVAKGTADKTRTPFSDLAVTAREDITPQSNSRPQLPYSPTATSSFVSINGDTPRTYATKRFSGDFATYGGRNKRHSRNLYSRDNDFNDNHDDFPPRLTSSGKSPNHSTDRSDAEKERQENIESARKSLAVRTAHASRFLSTPSVNRARVTPSSASVTPRLSTSLRPLSKIAVVGEKVDESDDEGDDSLLTQDGEPDSKKDKNGEVGNVEKQSDNTLQNHTGDDNEESDEVDIGMDSFASQRLPPSTSSQQALPVTQDPPHATKSHSVDTSKKKTNNNSNSLFSFTSDEEEEEPVKLSTTVNGNKSIHDSLNTDKSIHSPEQNSSKITDTTQSTTYDVGDDIQTVETDHENDGTNINEIVDISHIEDSESENEVPVVLPKPKKGSKTKTKKASQSQESEISNANEPTTKSNRNGTDDNKASKASKTQSTEKSKTTNDNKRLQNLEKRTASRTISTTIEIEVPHSPDDLAVDVPNQEDAEDDVTNIEEIPASISLDDSSETVVTRSSGATPKRRRRSVIMKRRPRPVSSSQEQPEEEEPEETLQSNGRTTRSSAVREVSVELIEKPLKPIKKNRRAASTREASQSQTQYTVIPGSELQSTITQTNSTAVRRSSRVKMPPLQFWKNERIVYTRPGIKEVIQRNDTAQNAPVAPKKRKARKTGTKAVAKKRRKIVRYGRIYDIDDDADSDDEVEAQEILKEAHNVVKKDSISGDVFAYSLDNGEGPPTHLPLAWGRDLDMELFQEVPNSLFRLAPFYNDPGSSAVCGMIAFNSYGNKPFKPTLESDYFFYVISGAVEANVSENIFTVLRGGSFVVPKGNFYSIRNILPKESRLFFVQAKDTLIHEKKMKQRLLDQERAEEEVIGVDESD